MCESVLNISAHKYGNYHKYYTFHPSLTRSELFTKYYSNLFYKLWESQDCPNIFIILDIGCNEGNLSIEVLNQARLEIPYYVTCVLLGIDIDSSLIELAKSKYYHVYSSNDNISNHGSHTTDNDQQLPLHGENNGINHNIIDNNNTIICFDTIDFMNTLQMNEYLQQFFTIIHTQCNYYRIHHQLAHLNQHQVHDNDVNNSSDSSNINRNFNIISLFSITMWIHLNYGDDGLIDCLFRSIALLHNKGSLIVEPQPWKCYKNADKML